MPKKQHKPPVRKPGGRTAAPGAEQNAPVKIGFIALGCAKNLVDLQVMGAELHSAGFVIGVDPEVADVILVNTCAFIDEAREEAVSAILNACELKQHGACKAVVVAGCLPQRYRENMLKACPDVDAIIGVDELDKIPQVVAAALGKEETKKVVAEVSADLPTRLFASRIPGFVLTGGPFAYLKIAEGCHHACAFCAIPGIRGKLRSRPIPEVVAEFKALLAENIREINIIAQDVTSYGLDLKNGTTLAALLRELDAVDGDYRIRLLYGHPAMITDELLDTVAASKHICRYFDIPIQHSHPDILRAMRRADTVAKLPDMADRIRAKVPGVTLRTTCLVGFPGETKDHFRHLMDFVAKTKFDHLGAFAFSPEAGTPAYDMGDEPDDITADERKDKLMRKQYNIVQARLEKLIGTHTRVLLEETFEDEETGAIVWSGRAESQAPDDIDGVTYIADVPDSAQPGDFATVAITGCDEYDLHAKYVAE